MSELIWAVKNGDLDQVEELIEKQKVDVNALVDGRLLLVEASDYGQVEVIQYLMGKGADVNAKDPRGISPLLAAIYEGHAKVVVHLLQNGANPKGTTQDGKSYIDVAETDDIKKLLRLRLEMQRIKKDLEKAVMPKKDLQKKIDTNNTIIEVIKDFELKTAFDIMNQIGN